MVDLKIYLILLLWCSSCKTDSLTKFNAAFETQFLPLYRQIRMLSNNIIGYTADSDEAIQRARQANKFQNIVPDNVAFPCNVENMRSATRPNSVHQLRPGDIDVIGAMGDSLSAGSGAASYNNILQIGIENRGLSGSGGGQGTWRQFLTLPNIIKELNPNLVGYAYGDSMSIMKGSQFNVAEPAALSNDLPYMARELRRRIKNDKRVDFENDWKLVSMLTGPNNICSDLCYRKFPETYVESHRKHLIKTFRYFRDFMPRTVINLILTPDFDALQQFKDEGVWPWFKHVACSCLFGDRFASQHQYYVELNKRWQKIDEEVAEMAEFTNSDTFQVILQPFSKYPIFPVDENNDPDLSYWAADNFHFSQKTHALVANSLWNNMLEPVGNKTETWTPPVFKRFLCPSNEHPYIYTKKNSQ